MTLAMSVLDDKNNYSLGIGIGLESQSVGLGLGLESQSVGLGLGLAIKSWSWSKSFVFCFILKLVIHQIKNDHARQRVRERPHRSCQATLTRLYKYICSKIPDLNLY